MIRRYSIVALLLPALLVAMMPALADASGTLRIPGSYRSWTVKRGGAETGTIDQLHLPVVATVGIGRQADLVLSGSGAFASVDPAEGSSSSLGGAADLNAQLFIRLLHDRLLVQAGAGFPTGSTELDTEEFAVARTLALPVLGFRAKDYGAGLNLSGGLAVAFPLAPRARFALGGGFVRRGSYTLFAGGGDYRPAPEVSASAGLDLGGGSADRPAALLRLDAVYRIYGKDELDGATLFEEGNQLELQAAGRSGGNGVRVEALALTVLKAENTVRASGGESVEELKASSGNAVQARMQASLPLGTRVRAGVTSEWNQITGSDTPTWDGHTYGVGPMLEFQLGTRGRLRLEAMRLGGKLDGGGEGEPDDKLTGTSVGLTLSMRTL